MEFPWYKDWGYDLLSDFQFQSLTMKEKGLYYMLKLLCATNKFEHGKLVVRRGGNVVPLQEHEISLSLGMDHSELVASLAKLVDYGLIDFLDGCYSFSKMISDRALSEKRGLAGSKGGSKTQAKLKQNVKQGVKRTSVSVSVSDSVSKSDSEKKENANVLRIWLKTDEGLGAWNEWREHLRERKKAVKTIRQEQKQLDRLNKLATGNERDAIEIINQAIAGGWIGLFELKTNGHASTNNRSGARPGSGFSATDEEFIRKNGRGDHLRQLSVKDGGGQ